jgi:hypothetical protein
MHLCLSESKKLVSRLLLGGEMEEHPRQSNGFDGMALFLLLFQQINNNGYIYRLLRSASKNKKLILRRRKREFFYLFPAVRRRLGPKPAAAVCGFMTCIVRDSKKL